MLYTAVALLALHTVTFALLRSESVQTFLAHQTADWLTHQLGHRVTIGTLRIGYRFDLELTNVNIPDSRGETFVSFEKLQVVPSRFRPAKKQISIASVVLDNARLNIVKYKSDSTFNYNDLIGLLGSSPPDTTAAATTPHWRLHCEKLDLSRVHFTYLNHNKPRDEQGMDYHFIDVNDIRLDAESVTMIADSFDFVLNRLSGTERSGLALDDFSGHFRVSPTTLQAFDARLITPKSDLDCDFTFQYDEWADYEDFIDSVTVEAFVRWSALNLSDLAPFSPSLVGMDNDLQFGGIVTGRVNNLKADQLTFTFGDESRFDGSVRLVGLPDVEETYIRLKINDFITNIADIGQFKLGTSYGRLNEQINIPPELRRLGFLGIKGNFTGFYNDFVADASFRTALGTITTDLVLRKNKAFELDYQGNLSLQQFDVGVLSGKAYLGPVTMQGAIQGHGVSLANLFLDIDVNIEQWRINRYNYSEIDIRGQFDKKRFSGILGIDDPNVKLSFNGMVDLNEKLPLFAFAAAIPRINLARLFLTEGDTTMVISAMLTTDLKASNLDNLTGIIQIDSLKLSSSKATYNLNSVEIRTESLNDDNRLITLRSDVADGLIKGGIKFSEIGGSATLFIRNYLASFKMHDELIEEDISGQHFSYQIHVRNPDAITALFFPTVKIAHNSRIKGYYDAAAKQFQMQAESPEIGIGSIRLKHWLLTGQTINNRLVVQTGCLRLILSESDDQDSPDVAADSLIFLASMRNDSIMYNLAWGNPNPNSRNNGDITGFADFAANNSVQLRITNSRINIGSDAWHFPPANNISIDSAGWHFHDFGLASGGQALRLNGVVGQDTLSKLTATFSAFDLSNLDPLLASRKMNADGFINGEASAYNLTGQPRVTAQIVVDGFGLNGFEMGKLSLNSVWNDQSQSLHIDAESVIKEESYTYYPLRINGYYYPSATNQNFDLKLGIENFNLTALNPLLEGNLSQVSGFATASLNLAGTMIKPDVQGNIKLMRTEFLVDYLNTRYSVADEISIQHDRIEIDNLVINDSLGHKAYCSGMIRHNYLHDFTLDMTVRPEQFIVMNTEAHQNRFFYGTAIASGPIRVSGPIDNITLNASTKLLRGTEIFLPLSMSTSVANNDFIVFLNQPHDSIEEAAPYSLNVEGFNLNFDLSLTPEAKLEIALPYQSGTIECRGQGDINLSVNSKGDLGLNGEYQITSGNFLFRYRNLFSRGFEIRQGSNIRFSGSPYDAVINLAAVHHNRTTLTGLDLDLVDSTITKARIPVNSIIRLKNKLLNPDISFGLEFPKLDESTLQQVYAKLDTTNEVIMTQQILSLLVLNNFSFTTGNNSISNSLGISGFELLSSQVSNLLSQVSRDIDIGINYRPGDNISAQEFELMLRTQLFDNRVTIDGNLGVTSTENSNRTSNIVGDVNVEVKLTEDGRFKFRAFNLSNNLDLLYKTSPYTQGVGFSYRREFNHLKDLFRKRTPLMVPLPEQSTDTSINTTGRNR